MLDDEKREQIKQSQEKRLFQEALKKRNLLNNSKAAEQSKIPSFAYIDNVGMIHCKICGQEFTNLVLFSKHLSGRKHMQKVEQIKRQIGLTEQKQLELIKKKINDDDFEGGGQPPLLGKRGNPEGQEDSLHDQIDAIKEMTEQAEMEKFEDSNRIDLPQGFFDDEKEKEAFEKGENKRIWNLKKETYGEAKAKEIAAMPVDEDRRLLEQLQKDVEEIEGQQRRSMVDDRLGGGSAGGGAGGASGGSGGGKEEGIGQRLVRDDRNFERDRVRERLERYKRLRANKRKQNV